MSKTAATSLPASATHAVSYRADIDGLRAIAIIAVVLFHADLNLFSNGFVGVDIFFVISGFLVGGHVFKEVYNERFSYSEFYLRRAKRILPALLVMVGVVSVLASAILTPDELLSFAKGAFTALLGSSNVWFWHVSNYFAPDAKLDPMLMTWSLGVEEQYYAFLPFLFLAFARFFRRHAATAMAVTSGLSFLAYLIASGRSPAAAFYLLPFRLWELGLGTLLAVHAPKLSLSHRAAEALGWAAALAMIAAIMVLNESLAVPLAVAGASVTLLVHSSSFNRHVLSAQPMIGAGLVSYSWYLWHWPLMAFVRINSVGETSVTALVIAGAISLPIAVVSWRYVEQTFRKTVNVERRRSTLICYAAALSVSAGAALVLVVCAGFPQRVGAEAEIVANDIKEAKLNPCLAGPGDVPVNRSSVCVSGSGNRVALIGDSHATMLAGQLRQIAAKQGFGLAVYTKATCPTLLGLTHNFPRWPMHAKQCAEYNRKAIAAVLNDNAVRTVVMAAMWSAPLEAADKGDRYHLVSDDGRVGPPVDEVGFLQKLRRTIELFVRSGRKVIVLGDVPIWKFDPSRQFYASRLPVRRLAQRTMSPHYQEHGGVVSEAWTVTDPEYEKQATTGVTYLPLRDAFCDGRTCRFMIGETLLFLDNQHLTPAGANLALSRFRKTIDETLSTSRAAAKWQVGGTPNSRHANL